MTPKRLWLAVISATVTLSAPAWSEAPADPNAFMESPEWLGQKYVAQSSWPELEQIIGRLSSTGERDRDGQFKLYNVTLAVNDYLARSTESLDEDWQLKFEEYQEKFPDSPFQPIVTAMQIRIAAFRAGGAGFSTPEGDALYRSRIVKAWNLMLASKERASRLPTWYEWAIRIGMDAGVPQSEVTALFSEGVKRFPGYHAIYFTMLPAYLRGPDGGAAAVDAFIKAQVSAKTNPDGEALYARLYWLLYQQRSNGANFFTETKVSWARMRAGFEKLIAAYPNSGHNKAAIAAFACRADDASTYLKWRNTFHPTEFDSMGKDDGIALEVCDARFTKSI